MLESILEVILTVFCIVVGVGFLIFVHELGHFLLAKRSGVKVETFALGFGPSLIKFTRGETEYRLCLIPLGGYVKMAGESFADEERTGADYEFTAKPPMTRIKIIVAGALMNFIVAFPLCILVYLIGINLTAPLVGYIKPDSAEWRSDIQPGDFITHVNNKAIATMEDYHRAIIRLPVDTEARVRVERRAEVMTATVVAGGSKGLGVIPRLNVVAAVDKNSSAQQAGLKPGDEILEVNNQFVFSANNINDEISRHADEAMPIKVRHPDKSIETLTIIPKARPEPLYELRINDLSPAIIASVRQGSPADGRILPKDTVLQINDQPIHSWRALVQTIRANGGAPLDMVVLRNEQEVSLSNIVPRVDPTGKGSLGIIWKPTNRLGEIPEDSVLAEAGLQRGDIIVKAQGKTISNLLQLKPCAWQSQGQPVAITVERGEQTLDASLTPRAFPQGYLGIALKASQVKQKYPLFKAIRAGISETADLLSLTFEVIWKLIKGDESPKGLAGPIGIFRASYLMVQEGVSKFIWLLALFSLNLAILNLLPIPVLDGGLVLFTLIEKIKGSPVSTRVLIAAQYIGLFLLLSLVLFVTYNDIFRSPF